MQEILFHPPEILDPRASVARETIPLAARLPGLEGKRLLLLDNGKLRSRYGYNTVVFRTIAQRLQEQYHAVCRQLKIDLLALPQRPVRVHARQIVSMGVEAVVLALCDSGLTAYTVVLAWELEQHGLPTVTLCTPQTLYLAAMMSVPVMPGLPLSELAMLRHASEADVAAETIWVLGEVVDALTTPPEMLRHHFLAKFAPDQEHWQANARGELSVMPPCPLPLVNTIPSAITFDTATYSLALYEKLCAYGMCDGLPVIPPTRPRVEAMLACTDRHPDTVLIPQCFPSGLPLTVQTLAINAVMAGCRADYFPILLTAVEAIAEPQYRLTQANITSHPAGNAMIVSGPLAREIGLASGGGCLGPGFRANMTLGRALSLALLNTSRALPGQADLSTMGSPAELAFCCAEHVQASPWSPLHIDFFDAETTSVTVLKCEGPHNVLDHMSTTAEGILRSIADVSATLGGNNAYVPADLLVFLNPEHAQIIHHDGWSKADIQAYIYTQARNPHHLLAGRGTVPVRPAEFATLVDMPVVQSPSDIFVIVIGMHGPHSMVGIPWGYSRAVTKAVSQRDGTPVRHIRDLQAR